MVPVLVAVGALLLMVLVAYVALTRLLLVCSPNEALIVSGRKGRTAGGRLIGYRVVLGGRVVRLPFIETVARLDLTNIVVELAVLGARTQGGDSVSMEGVANVKISTDPELIHEAIGRFLHRGRDEVAQVARHTLEVGVRAAIARLPLEEVEADPTRLADQIAREVTGDLDKLGLTLDTLRVEKVR